MNRSRLPSDARVRTLDQNRARRTKTNKKQKQNGNLPPTDCNLLSAMEYSICSSVAQTYYNRRRSNQRQKTLREKKKKNHQRIRNEINKKIYREKETRKENWATTYSGINSLVCRKNKREIDSSFYILLG